MNNPILLLKNKIKEKLRNALRQKFANYKSESSFMPFHTRLLGKDRMALTALFKVLIKILARVFLSLWQRFWHCNILM